MTRLRSLLAAGAILLMAAVSGCDIETETPPEADFRPASTIVVNEIFTLPLNHPAFFCWMEILNPTQDTVNLTGWTVSLETQRLAQTIDVMLDTLGRFLELQRIIQIPDSFGTFDVPFSGGVFGAPGDPVSQVRLPPLGLATYTSNEDRLRDHTEWGPYDENFRFTTPAFQGPLVSFDTLAVTDTTVTLRVLSYIYFFIIPTSGQILLKDPAGEVKDVVRYGNYVWNTANGADPYPECRSAGIVPDFEALCRYARGYWTGPRGNSAQDFFVTSPTVRPIPHWYSQLYRMK
ncbi:MAG: hypothetical protein WB626_04390 [Bacteroidota bacterium]